MLIAFITLLLLSLAHDEIIPWATAVMGKADYIWAYSLTERCLGGISKAHLG